MQIAKLNNKLIDIFDALDNTDGEYSCPQCGNELIVKSGSVNVAHFAHRSLADCDTFGSDMSEWHRDWQREFPIENREVIIEHEGKKHRADVCVNGYVLEFQNIILSPISRDEFNERTVFYLRAGYKVIGVMNLIDTFENEKIECYSGVKNQDCKGSGKHPRRFMMDGIPQKEKDVNIIFQTYERDPTGNKDTDYDFYNPNNYFERVTGAIYDGGFADYRRFATSSDMSNIEKIKKIIGL